MIQYCAYYEVGYRKLWWSWSSFQWTRVYISKQTATVGGKCSSTEWATETKFPSHTRDGVQGAVRGGRGILVGQPGEARPAMAHPVCLSLWIKQKAVGGSSHEHKDLTVRGFRPAVETRCSPWDVYSVDRKLTNLLVVRLWASKGTLYPPS